MRVLLEIHDNRLNHISQSLKMVFSTAVPVSISTVTAVLYDRYVVTRYYSKAMHIEFGMSQSKLHCTYDGDEPMKKSGGNFNWI